MACVLVPLAEAVGVSVLEKCVSKKNFQNETVSKVVKKLPLLKNMLYGGSFLLGIEHIYHGEITFVPPFLTATATAEGTATMLREMATNGISMALLATLVWGGILAVEGILSKFKAKNTKGSVA